jgi:hypothetical protein
MILYYAVSRNIFGYVDWIAHFNDFFNKLKIKTNEYFYQELWEILGKTNMVYEP